MKTDDLAPLFPVTHGSRPFRRHAAILAASALVLAACGSSSSSDPKTVVKSDLNPPAGLVSVTETDSMTLEWQITNTEDDIRGYNVYVIDGSIADLKAKYLTAGAFKGLDLSKQQVRRCKDTAALFKAFGFDPEAKQAKEDCDDFLSVQSAAPSSASGAAADGQGSALTDAARPSLVTCQTSDKKPLGDANLSVDIDKAIDVNGKPVSKDNAARANLTLLCRVPPGSTLSNGTKGFTLGKKYVAFVVAVQGKDADEISYTSNFVEDIPTQYTPIASAQPLKSGFYYGADIDTSKGTVDLDETASDCEGKCVLSGKFEFTGGEGSLPQFAILGDSQSESERLFVTGQKDKVFFAPAHSRNDFGPGDVIPGIYEPGDRVLAFDASQYRSETNFEVLPGSLFYVAVANGAGKYNYGKLYFQKISTNANGVDVPRGAGLKSFTALFALQTALGETFAERVAGIPAFFFGLRSLTR